MDTEPIRGVEVRARVFPGGGWTTTTALVNAGNPHEAMVEIKRHVYSKGELIRSLVRRREAESRMFLYGEYH